MENLSKDIITGKLASISANIEHYNNLYHKHITLANVYNKELWRWIHFQKEMSINLENTNKES
jgi:hypothetical protein